MEVREIMKLTNPLVFLRNIISRLIENPEDLENGQNGRYVGMRKKDHTEIKRWEYFLG
jgi:hypothetical protein